MHKGERTGWILLRYFNGGFICELGYSWEHSETLRKSCEQLRKKTRNVDHYCEQILYTGYINMCVSILYHWV